MAAEDDGRLAEPGIARRAWAHLHGTCVVSLRHRRAGDKSSDRALCPGRRERILLEGHDALGRTGPGSPSGQDLGLDPNRIAMKERRREDDLLEPECRDATADRICEYLDLDVFPLTTEMVTTYDRPYSNIAANYHELARSLKETPYARFF